MHKCESEKRRRRQRQQLGDAEEKIVALEKELAKAVEGYKQTERGSEESQIEAQENGMKISDELRVKVKRRCSAFEKIS